MMAEYYTIFGTSRAEHTWRRLGVSYFQNFLFSPDIWVVMELRLRAVPPRNRVSIPGNGRRFVSSETLPDHLGLLLLLQVRRPYICPLASTYSRGSEILELYVCCLCMPSWRVVHVNAATSLHLLSEQSYASCGPRPSPKWPVGHVTYNIKTLSISILCLKALFVSSSSHSCLSGPLLKKKRLRATAFWHGNTSRKIRRGYMHLEGKKM